jgi:hypothetical protein
MLRCFQKNEKNVVRSGNNPIVPSTVYHDGIQLYQVLYNIVSNRTKYCIPWYPIVPSTVVEYLFRTGNNGSARVYIFFEIMKKSDDPPKRPCGISVQYYRIGKGGKIHNFI